MLDEEAKAELADESATIVLEEFAKQAKTITDFWCCLDPKHDPSDPKRYWCAWA